MLLSLSLSLLWLLLLLLLLLLMVVVVVAVNICIARLHFIRLLVFVFFFFHPRMVQAMARRPSASFNVTCGEEENRVGEPRAENYRPTTDVGLVAIVVLVAADAASQTPCEATGVTGSSTAIYTGDAPRSAPEVEDATYRHPRVESMSQNTKKNGTCCSTSALSPRHSLLKR